MKVAIIGATGRVGGLVADELIARGHEVTGFVIDPENIRNKMIQVVEKNIFSITAKDLEGFDAVVSAFGQFTPGLGFQHQTAMMTLINALKDLPKVRLLVVGGAASLFTDDKQEKRVLELIPEQFHEVPGNMFKAFQALQTSNVNWTYFSPAYTFDPNGTRTGKYKLGTDVMFNNDEGESYISYADYALAMADEIEDGNFIGRRFTAVSNKNGEPEELVAVKTEFPDVEFEGLSQYRSPSVLELAGKSYYLILDDGVEGTLFFNTGEVLTWIPAVGNPKTDRYDCMKVDEDTYLVNWEVTGNIPRKGVSVVLDLEQNLVTVVRAYQGTSPKFPSLVSNDIVFGAIKADGRPLPAKRHGFTSDLVGTRINWRYNHWMAVTHVYFDANYIRVPLPKKDDKSDMAVAFRANPYDERCYYIKIKKNIYLISFLETNMTYRGKTGNNMLCLMDIARLHDCGRSFGLGGSGAPENYMFAAVGKWVDAEEDDFAPSKYRV